MVDEGVHHRTRGAYAPRTMAERRRRQNGIVCGSRPKAATPAGQKKDIFFESIFRFHCFNQAAWPPKPTPSYSEMAARFSPGPSPRSAWADGFFLHADRRWTILRHNQSNQRCKQSCRLSDQPHWQNIIPNITPKEQPTAIPPAAQRARSILSVAPTGLGPFFWWATLTFGIRLRCR